MAKKLPEVGCLCVVTERNTVGNLHEHLYLCLPSTSTGNDLARLVQHHATRG